MTVKCRYMCKFNHVDHSNGCRLVFTYSHVIDLKLMTQVLILSSLRNIKISYLYGSGFDYHVQSTARPVCRLFLLRLTQPFEMSTSGNIWGMNARLRV